MNQLAADEHEKQRLALSSKKRRDKLFALLKSDVVRMKSGKRVRLAKADARSAADATASAVGRANLENSVPCVNTTGQLLGAATAGAGDKRKSQATVDDIQCSGQPLHATAKRAAAVGVAGEPSKAAGKKNQQQVVVVRDDKDEHDEDESASSSSSSNFGGAATHSAVITFEEQQQQQQQGDEEDDEGEQHHELVLRSRTLQADTPTI